MSQLLTTHYPLQTRKGFTLVELLIYSGLLIIVVGLFGGILVTITRIQSQQNAARNVTLEANFVMTTIKRLVRDSTYLTITTSTLTVGTNSSTTDPTSITQSNGAITIQEAANTATNLTTSRVSIDSLAFTELVSGSSQAVKINMTLSFNTTNPQQSATQTLETTVAPLRKNN